jgi:hypothetical protein
MSDETPPAKAGYQVAPHQPQQASAPLPLKGFGQFVGDQGQPQGFQPAAWVVQEVDSALSGGSAKSAQLPLDQRIPPSRGSGGRKKSDAIFRTSLGYCYTYTNGKISFVDDRSK